MRRLIRTVVYTVLGFVVATTFVEAAIHVTVASPLWRVLPVPAVALYGPDPYTGYRHRPKVRGVWVEENRSRIVTSSLGLRDRPRPLHPGNAPRIVVLGNSVLEALQVDLHQTAVYVAETLLQDRFKGAEVVNLGLAGADPPVEVARLQSLGVSLRPDVAIVVLPINEFFSSGLTRDSEFTGYRRDADGQFTLHYAFRDSAGYRFRTSKMGQVFYWLLDHSEVMRIYNNRKNVGLFAEWPRHRASGKAHATSPRCFEPSITRQLQLWRNHRPEQPDMLVNAVIRDLAAIQRDHNITIVVAITGMGAGCPDQAVERNEALVTIDRRFQESGLRMVDLDGMVAAKVGAANVADLHGFRDTLGRGHLNVAGNRIYGQVLAQIIESELSVDRLFPVTH